MGDPGERPPPTSLHRKDGFRPAPLTTRSARDRTVLQPGSQSVPEDAKRVGQTTASDVSKGQAGGGAAPAADATGPDDRVSPRAGAAPGAPDTAADASGFIWIGLKNMIALMEDKSRARHKKMDAMVEAGLLEKPTHGFWTPWAEAHASNDHQCMRILDIAKKSMSDLHIA